jgi:hypothetical protein
VARAITRAVTDVLEVHHRLVVVLEIAVHGVVARAVRALQVCLPRFAAAGDEVTDVRGVDVIEGSG